MVLGEPEAERFLAALRSDSVTISAVSFAEAAIVAEARQGLDAGRDLELLVAGVIDRVAPVDEAHARVATGAWRRFGKGRHPAGLNFDSGIHTAAGNNSRQRIAFVSYQVA